jgi:hypothetical protein
MSLIELELIEELFTPEQTREIMIKLMDEYDIVAAGLGRRSINEISCEEQRIHSSHPGHQQNK